MTRQADYALRLMVAVGKLPYGSKITTATVAEQQKIPLPFLAKIVASLALSGLLRTERGAHGGVSLGRHADIITMLDIIEAIDGPIALNTCVLDPEACEFSKSCPTCEIFKQVQENLAAELKGVTLAYLVAKAQPIEA